MELVGTRLGLLGRADLVAGIENMTAIEFKTGTADFFNRQHAAQITLYAFVLAEMHRATWNREGSGLLIYLSADVTIRRVQYAGHEVCQLVILRNRLAAAAKLRKDDFGRLDIPDCEESPACLVCPQAMICSMLHRRGALGDCTGEVSIKLRAGAAQNHLGFRDKAFFARHSELVQRDTDILSRLEGMRALALLMSKMPKAKEARLLLVHFQTPMGLIPEGEAAFVASIEALLAPAPDGRAAGSKRLHHVKVPIDNEPGEKCFHELLADLASAVKSRKKTVLISCLDEADAMKTYLHVTASLSSLADVDASDIRQREELHRPANACATLALKKKTTSRARRGQEYDLVIVQEDRNSCLSHAISSVVLGRETVVVERERGAKSLSAWMRGNKCVEGNEQ